MVVRVPVITSTRSYAIEIGAGLLASMSSWSDVSGRTVVIVTDEAVGSLHAAHAIEALCRSARRVELLTLAGTGETLKSWPSVERVISALVEARADRTSVLVALGGGVVGDVAGFAAACYMRGIDCIQAPTTLLAQVDSSVGGKTAINHASGKNLIGAFHQPIRVIADTSTLQTLPQREFVAGLAEVVKYGAVADHALFEWLEEHIDALLARQPEALVHVIRRSCEIKAAIVAADEHETGRRVILNFGHTFGHAIESGTDYTWLHGEAVGCGMAMASEASALLGMIDASHAGRVVALLERCGLPTKGPSLAIERYLDFMRADKKTQDGELRLVLLSGYGSAVACPVDPVVVTRAIETFSP